MLDWKDAILAWQDTEEAEADVQWRKGDIALDLKPIYGGQTLEKFAKTVGEEYNSLRRYRDVSKAYESATRVAIQNGGSASPVLGLANHQFVRC